MPGITAIGVPGDRRSRVSCDRTHRRRTGRLDDQEITHAAPLEAQPGGPRRPGRRQPACCSPPAAAATPSPPPARTRARARAPASKTIVFSPLALQIPAMKQLSEGVTGLRQEQGLRRHRPGPEARPAEAGHRPADASIESGKAAGVWSIAIAPPSMAALVQTALDKGVPMILNGTPERLRPRRPACPASPSPPSTTRPRARPPARSSATASTSGYDGTGEVIFVESAPGTAGKEEFETRGQGRPRRHRSRRRDRLDRHGQRPHRGPDRHRQRAPGQPGRQRRLRPERRGCARRRRRLQGRRQGPALHHRGRRQRRDPRRGEVRRHLRRRSRCSSPPTWRSPSTRSPR